MLPASLLRPNVEATLREAGALSPPTRRATAQPTPAAPNVETTFREAGALPHTGWRAAAAPNSVASPTTVPGGPPHNRGGRHPQYTGRGAHSQRGGSFRPHMPRPLSTVPHSSALPPPIQRGRSLMMILRCIPPYTTIKDIFTSFQRYGNIVYLDLDEGFHGKVPRKARVRFEPFPNDMSFFNQGKATIWTGCGNARVFVEFEAPRRNAMKTPLGNPCPGYVKLPLRCLTFGVFESPTSVIAKKSFEKVDNFLLDFEHRKLVLHFTVSNSEAIGNPKSATNPVASSLYRAEISFNNLRKMYRVSGDEKLGLVITVRDPPLFNRKRSTVEDSFRDDRFVWGEQELYQRAVDIQHGGDLTRSERPVSLDEDNKIVDIGRWTTYWLELDTKEYDALSKIKLSLRDWNIKIADTTPLVLVPNREPELWSVIKEWHSEDSWSQYLGAMESHLPFDVRYQLEVCLSQDILSEYNMGREFVTKLFELSDLKVMGHSRARLILEYAADQGRRIFDPMSLFENKNAMEYLPATVNLPSHCTLIRKATITPTRIIYNTPTVETTNRVLRQYSYHGDHFLRIQVTDEMLEGRIQGCDGDRYDLVYDRVDRVFRAGIRMGNVHWKFLAYGNSQVRENGAFFFNETAGETCDKIRQRMGRFDHITVVAKYAARLGQCLSTTRPVPSICVPKIVKIQDVERDGRCFTDGVGMISSFLAKMVATDWKLYSPPSAIQFRMGGCKGVLVTWPSVKGAEVHVRKSQEKFVAEFNGLEVIKCSQYATASLNRQTIPILSSLGVPDKSFIDILREQISNYDAAMEDPIKATDLLGRYVDENQTTLTIKDMVLNGFMNPSSPEPFVHTILHLWRYWSIKALKEKTRLIVEQSAFVLGCVDETNTLRGHKKSTEGLKTIPIDDLPQIFLQISDPNSATKFRVITGVCIVGRNPSLHPGDIRVVEAVDVPALRHLKNVVVFPLVGDRDVPGMCSGGDLDGDDFFVIWDKRLIPTEWGHPPMDYTPPKPREEKGGVTVAGLKAFFTDFMKNNTLPLIAMSHMAAADMEVGGPKSKKCIELAQMHSQAVDYVKTGVPAPWDKKKHDARFWPHFMEKRGRNVRHSNKALGQLYDMVKKEDFDVAEGYHLPFDKRIAKTKNLNLLQRARRLKCQYDLALRRVMAQLEIATEFEVWTGFVMSRPRVGTAYKIQEKVNQEANALKKHFRAVCVAEAGGRDSQVLGPFVAAMYQVTCEEVGIARHEARTVHVLPNGNIGLRRISARTMPLISFPWLFAEVLGELAGGSAARRRGGGSNFASVARETDGDGKGVEADEAVEGDGVEEEDIGQSYTRTSDGQVIHRGEILNLFHQDDESEDEIEEDDHEEDDNAEEGPSPLDLDKAAGKEVLVAESTAAPDTSKDVEALVQETQQLDLTSADGNTNDANTNDVNTNDELHSDSELELEFEQDVIELPAESALERAARLLA